ncbi:MAG: hypothetical protein ACI4DO_00455 [Roseburia sp.]
MKKRVIVATMLTMIAAAMGACGKESQNQSDLYEQSVEDAVFADEDEIMDLVSLTREDDRVTWDDQGRVLLLTFHSYPDSYPEGEAVTLEWGEVWTFTEKEMASRFAEEMKEDKDYDLALKHLLGLPQEKECTTVTAFWVDPEDVIRPAYQMDATDGSMTVTLSDDVDEEYKAWFDENILDSYFYGDYPWTRLGYTYNWGGHGTEYGVTEFLVKSGSQVEVEYTKTEEEFVNGLE